VFTIFSREAVWEHLKGGCHKPGSVCKASIFCCGVYGLREATLQVAQCCRRALAAVQQLPNWAAVPAAQTLPAYANTSEVLGGPQAMDGLMPGFDKEIAKLAQRVLINPRKIDWHTGVLATKVTPGAARATVAYARHCCADLRDYICAQIKRPRL